MREAVSARDDPVEMPGVPLGGNSIHLLNLERFFDEFLRLFLVEAIYRVTHHVVP